MPFACSNNECDIRIQLPTVSGNHARIAVDQDGRVRPAVPFPARTSLTPLALLGLR